MQRQQCPKPGPRAIVMDKIKRHINAVSRLRHQFLMHQRLTGVPRLPHRPSQQRAAIKNLPRMLAQDLVPVMLNEAIHGARNQHRAAIPGE